MRRPETATLMRVRCSGLRLTPTVDVHEFLGSIGGMTDRVINDARVRALSLYMTRMIPLGGTVAGSAVSGLVSEHGADGRRPARADEHSSWTVASRRQPTAERGLAERKGSSGQLSSIRACKKLSSHATVGGHIADIPLAFTPWITSGSASPHPRPFPRHVPLSSNPYLSRAL